MRKEFLFDYNDSNASQSDMPLWQLWRQIAGFNLAQTLLCQQMFMALLT